MTIAEELVTYARTLRDAGQQSNYELCRDAAKSLHESNAARHELLSKLNLAEAKLRDMQMGVSALQEGLRRLEIIG